MSTQDRQPQIHAVDIELAAQDMRTRQAAADLLRRERAAHVVMPPVVPLDAFLAIPDEPVRYRVDGLLPMHANVLFAAQHKAGKSTAVGNLVRALADGDAYLDAFGVVPAQRVVLVDDELHESTLRRWLRDYGIGRPESVGVVSLRGRVSSFDIRDDEVRARWAEAIGPADVMILDCLRPILDALGMDEHSKAGEFLVPLDALKTEAGIGELVVVHHMGHAGQRSRGDSRLLDWPDVVWPLTRSNPDDPLSPRFFSAYGRDVDVREGQLVFDAESRRLSFQTGSRRDARLSDVLAAVVVTLGARGPMSSAALEEAMRDEHPRADIRAARELGLEQRVLMAVPGPKRARIWACVEGVAA